LPGDKFSEISNQVVESQPLLYSDPHQAEFPRVPVYNHEELLYQASLQQQQPPPQQQQPPFQQQGYYQTQVTTQVFQQPSPQFMPQQHPPQPRVIYQGSSQANNDEQIAMIMFFLGFFIHILWLVGCCMYKGHHDSNVSRWVCTNLF